MKLCLRNIKKYLNHNFIINAGTVNGEGTVKNLGSIINYGSFTATVTDNKPSHVVTFDPNGGLGTMDPLVVKESETVNLSENKYTREGYSFDHWNTKADGSGVNYNDKGDITITNSLTLYAQWKQNDSTNPADPSKSSETPSNSSDQMTSEDSSSSKQVKNVDKNQKKTSISELTAGKKSMKISWKKQTAKGIKGYEIQYSTDKKFKKDAKTVTINKTKTTSKTIKKLKSKKKYYVRIRTFKKSGDDKIYSKWSKAKNVKIK